MSEQTADFLVIGGGIIGISVARELKAAYPDASVVVLEKEDHLGAHASGRSSGVIHAGFYYSADSLKARFAREGNRQLTEYCLREGIRIKRCGKLVVARSEAELPQLDELLKRGRCNGVPLEMITADEARKIEPRVRTVERALFSPTTASADPGEVLKAMHAAALREGVCVRLGVAYAGKTMSGVATTAGAYAAGFVVNAGGLHADTIGRDFGFSDEYRILPFKGLYLYSDEPLGALRRHVYPVPDLRNPFLGVHFTVQANGHVKIGPTAIPALWREQYEGLSRFRGRELADIGLRQIGLLAFSGFGFQRLALEEIRKCSRRRLVALASQLVEGVRLEHYVTWARPGIRAQLVNRKTRALEMDFVVQGDSKSLHVLNAVSPGWTCALPFARHLREEVGRLVA